MSIRYKIAFLFCFLVTVILIVVSFSVFFFSTQEREISFQNRLKNRAISTARVYAGLSDSNYSILLNMDASAVASLYHKSITVVDYQDAHVYMYSDQPGDSLFLSKKVIEKTKIEDLYYFSYNGRKAVALNYTDSNVNIVVAVSAFDLNGSEYLKDLKKILILSSFVAAVFSFVTGMAFAKSLVSPIKNITEEVNLITTNNLSQRINIGSSRDELTRLALTFNSLLDRLQESFAIQRRFVSNASHELSTPLTTISTQLEVIMQNERSDREYRAAILSVLDDIREMQQLTRSLLDIAKTGSHGTIDLEDVRIDELLFKVISSLQKQNQSYKPSIHFENIPDDEKLFVVFGNSNLLYIALKNIIENSLKYDDANKSDISICFHANSVSIKVVNKGDIIAESDIDNIFQPFFRTQSAQPKPGFGLGLTLTKRILLLHKGSITVVSNLEKGTIFTIELPNILNST